MFNDRYGLTDAVLDGRKTMTRRLVGDFAPIVSDVRLNERGCAEARHGDVWFPAGKKKNPKYKVGEEIAIAQSYKDISQEAGISTPSRLVAKAGWTNKMFVKAELMPHRIRITDIKVEHLQDITEEDCMREGIEWCHAPQSYYVNYIRETGLRYWLRGQTAREAFADLIDKVSGKGTWASNPFVWVYSFELIK